MVKGHFTVKNEKPSSWAEEGLTEMNFLLCVRVSSTPGGTLPAMRVGVMMGKDELYADYHGAEFNKEVGYGQPGG